MLDISAQKHSSAGAMKRRLRMWLVSVTAMALLVGGILAPVTSASPAAARATASTVSKVELGKSPRKKKTHGAKLSGKKAKKPRQPPCQPPFYIGC